MTNPAPIRLLVADELPYSHGVENVSVALVMEFLELVEGVTWVTKRPSRARELKKRLPNAKNLNFASLFPAEPANQTNDKPSPSLNWKRMVKRLPFIGREARKAYRKKIDARLKQISQENRCTHCFVNYALSQTVPKIEIPVVGLIHDLNFLHYPDNFAPDAPSELRKAVAYWLQDADAVTVLSEAGKEELLGLVDETPNAHVEIIPNAIKTMKKEHSRRREKGPPIFLYPATALAHKNHLGLLQAARELALKDNDFQIIMTGSKIEEIGKKEPLANATVEKARCYYAEHEQILSKVVSFRAARDSNELSQLYREAHRVILPTQYEGFGLPLLEALSHGIRVTCSRIPQFLEQVTRYELAAWVDFFDAENAKSITNAMERSLLQKEEPLRFEEVEEKLARWQWKDSALAYLNLFAKMQLESPWVQH